MTRGRRKAPATETSTYVAEARAGTPEVREKQERRVQNAPVVSEGGIRPPSPMAIAAVLVEARRLLKEVGWCQREFAVDADGRPCLFAERIVAYSLVGAIQSAADGGVAAYHARRLLTRHVGNLVQWEDHPLRKRGDVLRLIDRAVDELAPGRRRPGGWTVTVYAVDDGGEGDGTP